MGGPGLRLPGVVQSGGGIPALWRCLIKNDLVAPRSMDAFTPHPLLVTDDFVPSSDVCDDEIYRATVCQNKPRQSSQA